MKQTERQPIIATWWLTTLWERVPRPASVISETRTSLMLQQDDGHGGVRTHRVHKITGTYRYFPTREAAFDHLITRTREKLTNLSRSMDAAQADLDYIEAAAAQPEEKEGA